MLPPGTASGRPQGDAIDGTGGDAQLAARAFLFDHGVHQLVGPDDGVDRARGTAIGAADAARFVDDRHGGRGRAGRERR